MHYLPVDVDAGQAARIIGDDISGWLFNGKQIRGCIDADNGSVSSCLDAHRFASTRIPHDISGFVATRPTLDGDGHICLPGKGEEQ
jgi:hypothetical protein